MKTTELLAEHSTGREYESVEALMNGEGISQEVKNKVSELSKDTRITLQLAKLRQKAHLTQGEMATQLGVTQSTISKLESGRDEDLTIGIIAGYAQAVGQRIGLYVGKPLTHVEAVKTHAMGMKFHLDQLVKIADQHEELDKHIQSFFSEAFFNLLPILAICVESPTAKRNFEVRIEMQNVSEQTTFGSLPVDEINRA